MPRDPLAISLFVVLAFLSSPSDAQQPPVAFPVEIEQVVVDVVVTDDDGQPITSLEKAEVEIYEDEVRQTISSFEMFEVAMPPQGDDADSSQGPAVRPRISSNAGDEDVQGRTFVIVFDDAHLTEHTAGEAREAVAEFLNSETREGDRITLVAPAAGIWWNTRMATGREDLLEMVDKLQGLFKPDMQPDRLTDYEAMRVHLYRDTMIIGEIQRRYRIRGVMTGSQAAQSDRMSRSIRPSRDPYIISKADAVYEGLNARNEVTLEAMERALDALVRRQGRKSLILVSEGFIDDTSLKGLKRVLTASLRANTPIYFLNNRGLRAAMRTDEDGQMGVMFSSVFRQEYETAGGSVTLAQDSGGFIMRDTDDLSLGLRRIADETRAYYLIGYNPTNVDRDGEFREIEIEIPSREGVDIRARKGYYAPSDQEMALGEEPAEDSPLQEAMDSPYTVGDLGLRMTHFVGEEASAETVRVSLAAEVDIEGLVFEQDAGVDVAAFQFVMVAMNRANDEHFRVDQQVDLKLPPEARAVLDRTWLPIVREFELGAGSYRAKIVLEETATGRLGSVIHDFKVPPMDPQRLRVSTPVLSDMRVPAENGQPGERPAIIARREFTPEAALYCRFEVYGAARLESSGVSRVSLSYEVRRSDGALYTHGARSLIEAAADGTLSHTIAFPLRAATADAYHIVMRVKDGLTGQTVELREAFSVSAPVAPAPRLESPVEALPERDSTAPQAPPGS